eukprot:94773_1
MSDKEIDMRWISPPKCHKEYVYPTQDKKDKKFYPAICYNNRIIKKDELLLSYQYQMDFIAFGEYFQICDETQIVYPGGIKPLIWNNPPFEKQHGFYTNINNKNKNKNKNNKNNKKVLNKQLKGTPSFDFLKIKFNDKSPLIGTKWENKNIIYSYPPGARKYNLDIREKKVQNRIEKEKQYKIQQMQITTTTCDTTYIINDQQRLYYHIEEYKDTESSSTSNSEDKLFESSDDDNQNNNYKINGHNNYNYNYKNKNKNKNLPDNAWTPDTNKWTQTLPEYQYHGLRNTRNTRSKTRNSNKLININTNMINQNIIDEIDKKYKRNKRKKRKKNKKKSKKIKNKNKTDDSEDEYILTTKDNMINQNIIDEIDKKYKRNKRKKRKKNKKKSKKIKNKNKTDDSEDEYILTTKDNMINQNI